MKNIKYKIEWKKINWEKKIFCLIVLMIMLDCCVLWFWYGWGGRNKLILRGIYYRVWELIYIVVIYFLEIEWIK